MIKQSWIYRNYKAAQLRIISSVWKPKAQSAAWWKVTTQKSIATTRAHRRPRFTRINSLGFTVSKMKLHRPAKSSNVSIHVKSWFKKSSILGATKRSTMFDERFDIFFNRFGWGYTFLLDSACYYITLKVMTVLATTVWHFGFKTRNVESTPSLKLLVANCLSKLESQ